MEEFEVGDWVTVKESERGLFYNYTPFKIEKIENNMCKLPFNFSLSRLRHLEPYEIPGYKNDFLIEII